VLANVLSAIIGAIWFDMLEKNRSVLDTIQQISTVLQYIEFVVANAQVLGHSTSLDGSSSEVNERGIENLVQSQRNFTMLNETRHDTNNLLGLSSSLSWSPNVFRGSLDVQSDLLPVINLTLLYTGDRSPNFNLMLLEQVQGELYSLRCRPH
jgi:hypothetical protein